MKKIIIAIDGHSSTGKSTVAKSVAEKLNYTYIDTGAMYRAVALWAIQNNWINEKIVDTEALVKSLKHIEISFKKNVDNQQQDTYLNGDNVEGRIRGLQVSQAVSPIATIPDVRSFLVKQQQTMGVEKGIVMDGRDIGTVVFPDADLKIFMTASPEIRAKRRFDELTRKGESVKFSDILANVNERDYIDENRSESPLRKADDALLLDNSELSRAEQLDLILLEVSNILG